MAPVQSEYHGNCHCGLFRFKIKIPELKSVQSCNCCFCLKNGVIWTFPLQNEEMVIESGDGALSEYQFGAKGNTHLFCPKCGSSIMSRGSASKGNAVNVRMLWDVDFQALPQQPSQRDKLLGVYEPPAFPPAPSLENKDEGMATYYGNCHCGAVSYAVKTKPLTEQEVMQCNCSLCSRNGDYFIYPPASSVNLQGRHNLVGYAFLDEKSLHSFCKLCGSSVCVEVLHEGEDCMPLNVRTLDGIDLDKLKYKIYDGASQKPIYKGEKHLT